MTALSLSNTVTGATIQAGSNLQSAIDSASPGDVILVSPGLYEKIVIDKSLSLIGSGATIRAGNRDACVDVKADRVSISGFLVEDGFYGIKLDKVRGCNISNNTVIHCTQPGIALLYSDDNAIIGNNASYNGIVGEGWYGIYLSNSNDNLIEKNVACGNGAYGINLFPSCINNTIRGNVLQGNMYGLYMFTDCSDNLIEKNDMSRNTNSGVDLRFNCTGNLITNNTLLDNVVSGLTFMEDSGQNSIIGNDIKSNGRYGLQIQSRSDDNVIADNNISQSQTGIFLEANENQIYGNRISDNVIQADDRGENTWSRGYPDGGNMWSDYSGEDHMKGPEQKISGSDGIGDEPYLIGEGAADRYPLMGEHVAQISVFDMQMSPTKARVGDGIALSVGLQSRYEIASVTARAYQGDREAPGYCRLVLTGERYQASFSTALLDPGRYELKLSVSDARGFEMQESFGEIEVASRGGYSSK